MFNAKDVLAALSDPSVHFSIDELRTANHVIVTRINAASQVAAQGFREGEHVAFEARGRTQVGTVMKVNQKTVTVLAGIEQWRVTGNGLRHATDAEIAAARNAAQERKPLFAAVPVPPAPPMESP